MDLDQELREELRRHQLRLQDLVEFQSNWHRFVKEFHEVVRMWGAEDEGTLEFRHAAKALEIRRRWILDFLRNHAGEKVETPEIAALEMAFQDPLSPDEVLAFISKHFRRTRGGAGYANEDLRRILEGTTGTIDLKVHKVREDVQRLQQRVESLPRPLPPKESTPVPSPTPAPPGRIRKAWTRFSRTRVAQETYSGFWEGWRKYVVWPGLLLLLGLLAERCQWIDVLP